MNKSLSIAVVTGSRADYGLLYWVMKEIQQRPGLCLKLFVTGMHLDPGLGETWKIIEQDGFVIDEKVETLLAGDGAVSISKSIGLGVIGFSDVLARNRPDLVLLLGDRFEILAAAQACLIARIPVAHLAGGDTTEGAFDESIRHAITKMAHLHFVTNEQALQRVRQMGENPAFIYNVGSPGIDYIRQCTLLTRHELEQKFDFRFRAHNVLVTFHPATLDAGSQLEQMDQLLAALGRLDDSYGVFFTLPNGDVDGRRMAARVMEFVQSRPSCRAWTSLGQQNYLSFLSRVDVVIGNSSSGLYEAPSFGIPTVNIGDRQKGRLKAASVIDCEPETEAIWLAVQKALTLDASSVVNPYGDGYAARRIVDILASLQAPAALLQKHFFNLIPHE